MPTPKEVKKTSGKASIFDEIDAKIAFSTKKGQKPIPLHIGDTHFDLPKELNWERGAEPWQPKFSSYGDTHGLWILRERLARKLLRLNALPVGGAKDVQITFGATGALMLAMRRLLGHGDTVLALAPYWPILRIVASVAGVQLKEVPFYDRVTREGADPEALIEKAVSANVRAIYLNNPNNPSGIVLKPAVLEAIAKVAKRHDLWVFSDEAYEDFIWTKRIKRVSIASLEGMFQRTVSVYSFSKSYAAAGMRLGYATAPQEVIRRMNAGMVGVGYEPPQLSQVMAMRGMDQRATILERLRTSYFEGFRMALNNLGEVDVMGMDGGFFLMLDLRKRWPKLTESERLDQMIKAGVVLAPGSAFGKAYEGWARLCFTAEPPERIAQAVKRIAKL